MSWMKKYMEQLCFCIDNNARRPQKTIEVALDVASQLEEYPEKLYDWFRALQIDNCQKAANAVKQKYENVWQPYFEHKAEAEAEQQHKRSEQRRSDNDAWLYTFNAMF